MRLRDLLLAAALGTICFGFGTISSTSGQVKPAPEARLAPMAGRYQLAIAGPGQGIYMTDTVTGDCFNQVAVGEWNFIGNPRAKSE